MNHGSFDALTRRASLATLGGVGMTALVHPVSTAAKSKNKKSDKKARQKCQTQVEQCTTLVKDACNDDLHCLTQLDCCEFAGRCDFTGFLNCLIAKQA
jgi:hypothetical protein